MRPTAFVLVIILLLSAVSACVPAPGPNFPDAPTLILNGEKLDVYTSHYFLTEERAVVPLIAFLMSIGADYADSPINEYGKQCYSFMGKRYICVAGMHLFMQEDDYMLFMLKLEKEGEALTREAAADSGLFPRTECWECKRSKNTNETVNELWIDHVTLMNALNNCGIDIAIDYSYLDRTITVTLPDKTE